MDPRLTRDGCTFSKSATPVVVLVMGLLGAAGPATGQSGDYDRMIRRCESELEFRIAQDSSVRSAEVVLDYRRAQTNDVSRTQVEITGPGRYLRDSNTRGRPFTYRCRVDTRSGRVAATYNWGTGGGWWENSDNRPGPDYPSRPSAGYTPQGRVFFSGGIVSKDSGKALDVAGGSNRDQANVQQWDFVRNQNQLWDVIDQGRGEYVIVNQASNKVLDVARGRDANGAEIVQYRWQGGENQRWRLERAGDGSFRIVNVGSGRCLDVQEWSHENGGNIQLWDCAGQNNQAWRLVR